MHGILCRLHEAEIEEETTERRYASVEYIFISVLIFDYCALLNVILFSHLNDE